jgi:hypothetical protein
MFGSRRAQRKKTARGGAVTTARERMSHNARAELLLPGALLVTVQAQLLAPFVLVDFCLAAFFQ